MTHFLFAELLILNRANEIWVANADGSGAKQLTRLGSMATGSPAWSGDGRTIVFESKSQGQMDLYVIGSNGGEPKVLAVTSEDELVPSFSRDGRSIYYSVEIEGTWSLMRMPIDGGKAKRIQGEGAFAGQESPDGCWVYFTRRGQEVGGVWRMPVAGGAAEMLVGELPSRFWGQWAVSATGLYYAIFPGSGTQSIRRLDLASRRISDVVTLNHLPSTFERGMSVTQDERQLVWSQLDYSGIDIYVVDGFRAP